MSKIVIETLGCRLNQIESESIARYFLDKNFSVQMESLSAQSFVEDDVLLCFVNTCAVTQKSEQKARRIIRLLLKKYPNSIIVVTGCYAQLSSSEIEKIDDRIVVIGGQIKSRLSKIPELLEKILIENTKNQDASSSENCKNQLKEQLIKIQSRPVLKKDFPEDSFKLSTTSFLSHSRASLKIQDGCNNNCAFCTIHTARGHSVSLDVQTAINRVKEMEKSGQREIVLTTINIAQYRGKNGDEYCNFTQLLKLLLENTKNVNFRISSLYPEIIDDDFCAVVSDKRVRPHFHISVQSGSNKILKLMNRRYLADDVISACTKLRKVKQNPFIACDIITGFPGETSDDFEETMELCKKCDFSWVHAFPFSERPGTEACNLTPKIPQSIIGERAKKLTDWAIQQKINYINSNIGNKFELILESPKSKSTKKFHGMTENFIHCELSENYYDYLSELKSKYVEIIIEKALPEKIKKGGEIEATAKLL